MIIDVPIVVKSFDSHFEIKNELLKLLDEQNFSSFKNEQDSISKTDWYLEIGKERKYWNFLYPIMYSTIKNVAINDLKFSEELFKSNLDLIKSYWFQQYYKNDNHGWHVHFFCSYF